jgi:hypothetical protein
MSFSAYAILVLAAKCAAVSENSRVSEQQFFHTLIGECHDQNNVAGLSVRERRYRSAKSSKLSGIGILSITKRAPTEADATNKKPR